MTKEENQKKQPEKESELSIPLEFLYFSPQSAQLYISNTQRTKLKHILSGEIKPIEGEIILVDLLLGKTKTTVDESILAEMRSYFKLSRQIGFNPENEFDFLLGKNKKTIVYIKNLESLQSKINESLENINF